MGSQVYMYTYTSISTYSYYSLGPEEGDKNFGPHRGAYVWVKLCERDAVDIGVRWTCTHVHIHLNILTKA